jgi:hypothetical protein
MIEKIAESEDLEEVFIGLSHVQSLHLFLLAMGNSQAVHLYNLRAYVCIQMFACCRLRPKIRSFDTSDQCYREALSRALRTSLCSLAIPMKGDQVYGSSDPTLPRRFTPLFA